MWSVIGKLAVAYVLIRLLLSLLRGIYSTYLAHMLRLNMNLSKTGKWAVVTGSTDGIGKAYAFELAARGLNIVLISRTLSKLQTVAAEIKEKYPVEVKIIAADFTLSDIYDNIAKELKGLDIGVLVNNVGMGYDYPESLTKVKDVERFCTQMMDVNITSMNRMTFIVLPGMEERKRGVIINISSFSIVVPGPYHSLYAATKAYMDSFSCNLHLEVKSKGVTVQSVLPGFVMTNMIKIKTEMWGVPRPTTFVRQALATVGVETRTGGFILHKLMVYVSEVLMMLLPSFIIDNLSLFTMKRMRTFALKLIEKEAQRKG